MAGSPCYWNTNEEYWQLSDRLWNAVCEPEEPSTSCNWEDAEDIWGSTDRIWNICPEIGAILTGRGSRGTLEDAFAAYKRLDKHLKRKVLRLILHYKGQEYSQQREVRDDLGVTVSDIGLLIDHYGEWRRRRDVRIIVDNVRVI